MRRMPKHIEIIYICVSLAVISIISFYALRNRQNIETETIGKHSAADSLIRKKIDDLIRDDIGHEVPKPVEESPLSDAQSISSRIDERKISIDSSLEQSTHEVNASYKKESEIELKSNEATDIDQNENQLSKNREQEPDPTEIIDFVLKNRTTKY